MSIQLKIEKYLKGKGFTSIGEKVTEKLENITKCLTNNILQNLTYVADANTIKETHVKAVSTIINQMGGDPVQSSEFYGVDSGRYYSLSEVAPLETNMFSNENLARVDMVLQGGGGGAPNFIDKILIKKYADLFIENNKLKLKIDAKTMKIVEASVKVNVDHILDLVLQNKKTLTVPDLKKIIKTDSHVANCKI